VLSQSNRISCLSAFLLFISLTACSGGGADPAAGNITIPVFGTDDQQVTYIGSDRCLTCHEALTPDPVASYLASRHGWPGSVDATADPACLSCHDPIGDGRTLAPWFSDRPLPAGGMAAVGCENCHGAGPLHLAIIPDHPNPVPDFNVCGKCHGALPTGVAAHGTGIKTNILAAYQQSAHANTPINLTIPLCARCHSDEVFRQYGAETAGMDGGQLADFFIGVERLPTRSPIQCRTCHNGHDGTLRATATTAMENGTTVIKYSRQFNLCTSCHQVFLTATYNPASAAYSYLLDTSKVPFHGTTNAAGKPNQASDVIWDNHFATEVGGIALPVNPASEQACVLCHDPHGTTKFI